MAIMLKSSIQAILLDQLDNHESLFLQKAYSGRTFILCGVYRPPSAESDYLRRLQDRMCTFRKTPIILVGDLNVPGIEWVNENIGTSENSEILSVIMLTHNLHQVVTEPTRVHGSSSSILDLVFLDRCYSDVSSVVHESTSDHNLVAVSFSLSHGQQAHLRKDKTIKDYSKAKDESVLDYRNLLWTHSWLAAYVNYGTHLKITVNTASVPLYPTRKSA